MPYQVGVDVGETFTTAAVIRGGRAEVVRRVPSRLPGAPRGFLRRVGDDTPVLVGTRPVPAESLVAQLVAQVVSPFGTPAGLAVTYPVAWGPHRVAALRAALGEVTMLSTAAAVAYRRVAPTAVHDLGGSTFTAAVVNGLATVGRPAELDLGGTDLDELVFDHVCAALETVPADPVALAQLRQACARAKESLSADTEVEIPVAGNRVRLTRAEFEEMARPLLAETAVALRLTIEESGVTPTNVLLAGGAAWLPLLTQVVSEELGRPVTATPPGAAAMGAAMAAAMAAAGLPVGRPVGTALPPRAKVNQPTRLAVSLEPVQHNEPAFPPAGNEVRTSLVEPVRPPVPVAAAPAANKSKRPRAMLVTAAAAFAVLGGAAALALTAGQTPAGAGADTRPTTATVTQTVATTEAPPAETPTRRAPEPQPTKPRPTTTTTRKPAEQTTTSEPTTTGTTPPTTTTSRPSQSTATETTEGGDR